MSESTPLLPDVMTIARLVLKFGEVERATAHEDGRPETDTTHTVMLALVAWLLVDTHPAVSMDMGRLLMFCIVHDLPEFYRGDVNTARELSAEEQAAKDEDEAAGLAAITASIPRLGRWIEWYERQDTPEARFVRYLDKVLPKLTHTINGFAVARKIELDLEEMRSNHRKQGAKLAAEYPEMDLVRRLFEEACAMSEAEYEAQGGLDGESVAAREAPMSEDATIYSATSQHGPCDGGDRLVRNELPFMRPDLKTWCLARLDAGEIKYGASLRVGWEKADEALREELADAINYAVSAGRYDLSDRLSLMLEEVSRVG